jgi:hypothetical protein
MPDVQMTLQGLPPTLKKLAVLPDKIQKRATVKAIRAGAAPFVKAAKRNAPQSSGLFKRSLTSKIKSYRSGAVTLAIIGQLKSGRITATKKLKAGRGGISGRGDLVPIHLIENDVRPHAISATMIRGKQTGGRWRGALRIAVPPVTLVYRRRVHHPGYTGRHPIGKAAAEAEAPALTAFTEKLRVEVDRESATPG